MGKRVGASLLLVVLLILSVVCPQAAEKKKIKIGYIDYGSFIEKEKEGGYTGYGVEYLNEIAKYTNWEYVYIYDTWENCMKKLKNGELDFLGTAQKTPERIENYAFADIANGVEQTVLYTSVDNDNLYYNDYKGFNGKTVALMKGSFQTEFFEKYAKEHNFTYKPVYVATEEEMVSSVKSGVIDIMVGGSLALHTDMKVIGKEGADPFYFMTYKENTETLAQLNDAMAQIQNEHPYYSEELAKQYYGDSVITSQPQFTREEVEYIKKAPVIKVGCLSDCYPISRWDEKGKRMDGIAIDLMNNLAKTVGINVEYIPLPSNAIPMDYLKAGKVDLLLPSIDTGYRENDDTIYTNKILDETMVPVMRQGDAFKIDENYRVVLLREFPLSESLVARFLKGYKAVYKDTTDECLRAVLNGEADVYFDNYYIASYRLKSPYFKRLQKTDGHSIDSDYAIAALDKHSQLITILNKGINSLDENVINNIIGAHTLNDNYENTLGETLYGNRGVIFSIATIVFIIIFALALFTITQRRNVIAMQEKNRELSRANRARQSFLSNMSHEIRTPLNGIKGSLDILTENDYDTETNELLSMSATSANHLLNLVNDILDMSKIESGKFELHPEYIQRGFLVEYLEAIIVPMAQKKNISVQKHFEDSDYEYIYVDRNRLSQICINLLTNSVKYTNEGGKIDFTIKTREIAKDNVELTVIVQDNGIGMTREFLAKAMEPFMQERNADTLQGSGLGLAITKSLVALFGGTMEVESEIGVGTKTTVKFATKAIKELPKKETILDTATTPKIQKGEKHLLIVEDNAINRKIAVMQAEKYGFIVDTAVNGREAVDKFIESIDGYYSMILMDVMMPVMGGLEATKEIRALPREDAKAVIIVAMTANSYVEDVHKSIESGMNAHLSKPFNKEEIKKIFDLV